MSTSPEELVERLRNREPLALDEFRRRFVHLLTAIGEDVALRYGLDSNLDLMADRLVRVIHLHLQTSKPRTFSELGWEAFNSKIEEFCRRFLTDPVEYQRTRRSSIKKSSEKVAALGIAGSGSGLRRRFARIQGLCVFGDFVIRHVNQPKDWISGDSWDCVSLSDGSLVVLVADVMGHDICAGLLSQGVPALFRVCVESQKLKGWSQSLPFDLAVAMDAQLAGVLPEGVFVQVCIACFPPERRSQTGEATQKAIPMVSETSPVVWHNLVVGPPGRALAMTAALIGYNEPSLIRSTANSEPTELLVGTDGLYEQPLGAGATMNDWLVHNLQSVSGSTPLLDQVVARWQAAVVSSGGSPNDDMCMITVSRRNYELSTYPGVETVLSVVEECRSTDDNKARLQFCKDYGAIIMKAASGRFGSDTVLTSEDAFHEILLHIWNALCRNMFTFGNNLRGWVSVVATNKTNDLARRFGRDKKRRDRSIETEALRSTVDTPGEIAGDNDERQQSIERLNASIEQLTDNEYTLLQLMLKGLSDTEIGVQIGTSRQTAATQKHRLKNKLKRLVNQNKPDDGQNRRDS